MKRIAFGFWCNRILGQFPLQVVLMGGVVLPVAVAAGGVGYFSWRNSAQAVQTLSRELIAEIGEQVQQELENYLETPHLVNQLTVNAFQSEFLQLDQPAEIERHFLQQVQAFKGINYVYMGSAQGGIISPGYRPKDGSLVLEKTQNFQAGDYLIYALSQDGQLGPLLETFPDYDARRRSWYRAAIAANKPVWGNPYLYFGQGGLALPAVRPIYDKTGTLQGVAAADILLTSFSDFLETLPVGQTGQVFVMERSGLLLASSTPTPLSKLQESTEVRLQGADSDDSLIQAVTENLQARPNGLADIQECLQLTLAFDRQRHFVQVAPWQDEFGLDWLIVIAVPQSDFMAQIDANTQLTLRLCLLAVVVAAVMGALAARWITRPILRLNESAQKLAKGTWHEPIMLDRTDELGALSDAFNVMASQLQVAFETLEFRVDERTQQLAESNRGLAIAKEKAEIASQAKSLFIANISHELRTPLHAILGFAEIMMQNPDLSPREQDHARIIYRSGDHLICLINTILDFSKLEAGQLASTPQPINLHRLLESLQEMFQVKAIQQHLKLSVTWDQSVPQDILVDELRLRQVLINLLDNALKFTQQGQVTLRVGAVEPSTLDPSSTQSTVAESTVLSLTVQDSGVGIAPEELALLFEPFTQTQSGRDLQIGTGLGLPLSLRLVELMGGTLQASSQVGIGTTMRILLPVTVLQPQESPDKLQAVISVDQITSLQPDPSQYRILIVDDSAINRLVLRRLLGPLGFDLAEAEDGQAAIALWSQWHPHLIWMDLRMPIMDGIEATQRIRAHPDAVHTPTKVIALTASGLEEDWTAISAAGADDFLRKPVRRADVLAKMAKHLDMRCVHV